MINNELLLDTTLYEDKSVLIPRGSMIRFIADDEEMLGIAGECVWGPSNIGRSVYIYAYAGTHKNPPYMRGKPQFLRIIFSKILEITTQSIPRDYFSWSNETYDNSWVQIATEELHWFLETEDKKEYLAAMLGGFVNFDNWLNYET